ncbi:MAG: ABC transporter substrate-binding protein [Ectothiorhodospiraceae bacterium]|nr:ABC transporter substrate-binding protein [Ectothiorhodospiraceae bacterium]
MWVLCCGLAMLLGVLSMPPAQAETRLEGVVYLGDIPTLVASEFGFFSKQGLELEVAYGDSGLSNLRRLRAGQTDFALMALTPLILEAMREETAEGPNDPLILASISHSIGLNFIMARQDSRVRHPVDLRDARIALVRGSNAELLLDFFLEYHGIQADAVNLVDLPIRQVFDALAEGEADAAVLWEPWATRLDARLGEPQRRFDVSNVYTARWLLVVRREVLEREAETVRLVLRAYRDAIRFMDAHPEEAIALYGRMRQVSAEQARANWHNLIYGLSLNWSLITAMQQQAEWSRDAGYAGVGVRFRPFLLIAPEPLHSVLPTAVSLPSASSFPVHNE